MAVNKKRTRVVLFPFFSKVEIGPEPDGGRRWRVRLSGDFRRILKHTAPAAIPKADRL